MQWSVTHVNLFSRRSSHWNPSPPLLQVILLLSPHLPWKPIFISLMLNSCPRFYACRNMKFIHVRRDHTFQFGCFDSHGACAAGSWHARKSLSSVCLSVAFSPNERRAKSFPWETSSLCGSKLDTMWGEGVRPLKLQSPRCCLISFSVNSLICLRSAPSHLVLASTAFRFFHSIAFLKLKHDFFPVSHALSLQGKRTSTKSSGCGNVLSLHYFRNFGSRQPCFHSTF